MPHLTPALRLRLFRPTRARTAGPARATPRRATPPPTRPRSRVARNGPLCPRRRGARALRGTAGRRRATLGRAGRRGAAERRAAPPPLPVPRRRRGPGPGAPAARAGSRRLRLLEHLGRPPRRGAVQVVQELLLAGEVTVNRPFGDAGLLGDFGRRRGLIPAGREVLEGGAREALAGQIGDRHRPRI